MMNQNLLTDIEYYSEVLYKGRGFKNDPRIFISLPDTDI